MLTKSIAYNERFVHLQIGLCKCQYLGTLGPIRQWTHPMVTSWPSYIPCFVLEYAKQDVRSNLIYQIGWSFPSWVLTLTSCSSVDMRNISYFFLFIFKTTKIRANNLMLSQYVFNFKIAQILSFFIGKY